MERGILGILEDIFNFKTPDIVIFRSLSIYFALVLIYISFLNIRKSKDIFILKDEIKKTKNEDEIIKINNKIKVLNSKKRIGYYFIPLIILLLLSGLMH